MQKVISTSSTPYCNKVTNIPNMFSTVYYEELSLIVTKGKIVFVFEILLIKLFITDGAMSWYLPRQDNPFLHCYNPALKNIKYISFSGYGSRPTDATYIMQIVHFNDFKKKIINYQKKIKFIYFFI